MFAGATLVFDVELINISDSPPTTNVFREIDSDQDNQISREEVRTMARSFFFNSFRILGGWLYNCMLNGKEKE